MNGSSSETSVCKGFSLHNTTLKSVLEQLVDPLFWADFSSLKGSTSLNVLIDLKQFME